MTAIGRLLASGLTVFTYLFFRALIAFPAYQRGTYRIVDEAIDAPRIPAKAGGTRVIRFFVDCYHQSFFYARLKRRGVRCRYLPSCTDYAVRAVDKYGYRRGLMLASGRFRRCNPSYKHDYLDFP